MKRFDNRTVIVTGGARGMGASHARGFVAEGAIVNISSGAGMTGTFGVGAYVASKWGVRGLTKTAALELARDNIHVNSITPAMSARRWWPGRTPRRSERGP